MSRDGQWLALQNLRERQEDIFVMRSDGTEVSRVTDDAARDRYPFFALQGEAITFYSNRGGPYQGFSVRRDGGDRTQVTNISEQSVNYTSISPDGRRVLVVFQSGDWLIAPAPDPPVTLRSGTLTKAPLVGGGTFAPITWSRDGQRLTGRINTPSGTYAGNAIYDLARGAVTQLSADGGPMDWMPDHRRVVYFTMSGKLMIQDVGSGKRHEIEVKLPLPPDADFNIVTSPDGRTIYYGAQQTEANIWKVERKVAARK